MNAEYFAFDDSSDTEMVEDICAILPGVCVAIFSDSFIVKAVSCRNLSRFVVTSQQSDTVGPLEFEAHQILESFQ